MTRVAVVLPRCPQQAVTFFATLRLGAVVVSCDPKANAAELGRQLADSGATVVVCLDGIAEEVRSAAEHTQVRCLVVTSDADGVTGAAKAWLDLSLRTRIGDKRRRLAATGAPAGPATLRYRALLRSGTPARQAALDPVSDPAVLLSLGEADPGLVMLSHANLVAAALQAQAWRSTAVEGGEPKLETAMAALLQGPLFEPELRDVALPVAARQMVPLFFGHPAGAAHRDGSVGVPLPGTSARVVDPDDPRRGLPAGEWGALAVCGPQVPVGYWRREADVSPMTTDGWWLTGLTAAMRADGWFSIAEKPDAT